MFTKIDEVHKVCTGNIKSKKTSDYLKVTTKLATNQKNKDYNRFSKLKRFLSKLLQSS